MTAAAEFWATTLSGAVAGVAAAFAWAGLIWIYNISRNGAIRHQLRESLHPQGAVFSVDGYGFTIENSTGTSIVVRHVSMRIESKEQPQRSNNYTLNYDSDALRRPSEVEIETFGSLLHQAQVERRFTELPPKTEGRWLVPLGLIDMIPADGTVTRCEATFEYTTLLGDRDVVHVVAKPDFVAQTAAALRSYISNELPKIRGMRQPDLR